MSEQCGERAPGPGNTSRKNAESGERGPFLHVMMLMGQTAGLGQRAGAWTGDGLVAGGRGVAGLLKAPSKLLRSRGRRAKKRRTGARRPDVRDICAKIGLSICRSALVDPSMLLKDLQSGASVSSLHDDAGGARTLTLRMAAVAVSTAKKSDGVGKAESQGDKEGSTMERPELTGPPDQLGELQTEVEEARARAAALEADLASVRGELGVARQHAEEMRAEFSSQVSGLQSEKESLLSDLDGAQVRAEKAESRATDLDSESSDLRESLRSAVNNCEELQDALEHERSSQRAEAEVEGPSSGEIAPPTDELIDKPAAKATGAITAEDAAWQAGERRVPVPAPVTPKEAHAAVFSGEAEKVLFVRALLNLESAEVRARAGAVRAIGAIPHELAARALISRFHREPSAEVRQECLCVLTALDSPEAIPVAHGALEDSASSVRLAAVRAMYRLVGMGGADALVRLLDDKDEDVRRRVVTCLGWLGHKPLAFKLVSLLADPSAAVRLATLEALGNLKSPAVVDDVIELLDDPEESVQKAAFHALETITGKQMGERFPDDKEGRKLMIARWQAWGEKGPSHIEEAASVSASG